MKPLLLLWLGMALFVSVAVGQSDPVTAGPKLLVYGVNQLSDCSEEISAVRQALATLPYPSNWTVGVVCNQAAWETLTAIAHVRSQTGFSNLILHTTAVNARRFRESRARFHHTLAHELGHIRCQCDSEAKAEGWADRLEHAALVSNSSTSPPASQLRGSH